VHLQEEGLLDQDGQRQQLTCASCHQPNTERQYPWPINYEQHCARCHPLSVLVLGDWPDAEARQAAAQFRRQPAPHRQPAEVRAALRERYTQFVQHYPVVLDSKPAEPPQPPLPGTQRPRPVPSRESWNWVEAQLQQAERLLFAGAGACRYCHEARDPAAVVLPGRLPEFVPTNLARRWYPRSHFSHDSHRLLSCTECHAATDSSRTSDALLPRVDTCQKCHNPQVGVRSECITCHRYHDRGRESPGKGQLTIVECLGSFGEK
jgi:hypothetical protein